MKKSLIRKLIFLVILVSFLFLFEKIYQQRSIIFSVHWKFDAVSLVFMLALQMLNYIFNIIAWHVLSKSTGLNITFIENFRIWAFSSLTRFLPGKIWQYPGRVLLLKEKNVPTAIAGTLVIEEILFNLCFGLLVIYFSLTFWILPPQFSFIHNTRYILLPTFAILFYLVFTNKNVLEKLIILIKKISGKNLKVLKQVSIQPKWLLPIAFVFSVRFIISGEVLFFMTKTVIPIDVSLMPAFIGAFSLSWLFGYIAFFAPAGLGVAEISLALLLSQYMPLGLASIISISFRVANLFAEMLLVFGIFILKPSSRHPS